MKPHRWYRLRSSIPAFAIVAASLCLAGCPSVPETNSPPQDSETAAQPPSRMDPQRGGILRPDARPPMLDQRRFDEAAAAIRRLPIDSFPQLPEAVAGVLREKGCLVPQPEPEGPGVNVISGEFFAAGQAGWAVLCSTNGQSVILVFRDESGASPEELAPADDRGFLQGVGNGAYLSPIRAKSPRSIGNTSSAITAPTADRNLRPSATPESTMRFLRKHPSFTTGTRTHGSASPALTNAVVAKQER